MSDVCLSDVCLSRTSGLNREQRGLGRPKLAKRCPTSHATRTTLSRLKGHRSRSPGVRWLQRSALERIRRGKVSLRCVCSAARVRGGGREGRGHIVSPRAQLVICVLICRWRHISRTDCRWMYACSDERFHEVTEIIPLHTSVRRPLTEFRFRLTIVQFARVLCTAVARSTTDFILLSTVYMIVMPRRPQAPQWPFAVCPYVCPVPVENGK